MSVVYTPGINILIPDDFGRFMMNFKFLSRLLATSVVTIVAVLILSVVNFNSVAAYESVSEKEPNDSIKTAEKTVPDTVYTGRAPSGDIDYYKIELKSSGYLKITEVDKGGSFDFDLLDSEGNSYNFSLDAIFYGRHMRMGTYYLSVSPLLFPDNSEYGFYYTFEDAGETFPDTGADDIALGANKIKLNNTYKGQIAFSEESDFYKFDLQSAGKLTVKLYSSDSVKISFGNYYNFDQHGETYHSQCLEKGTYYLQISCGNDATYSFSITLEPVRLEQGSMMVVCGDRAEISILNADYNLLKHSTKYESSDSSIASVDADGKVTGRKAGPATVYVTVGGTTLKCSVQVLYKDVVNTKEYWFEPTNYLTNEEVVKGYDGQTMFRPNNQCTRAQMVTFLWRLKGCPKPQISSTKFKDVKKSAYYYKAVLWAVEKGITTGYSKTKFKPNNVCTRAQTVTFLWRMAGKPKATTTKNKFRDIDNTDYFYNAVLWASEKKIVEGYKNKTFRPQNKCTRRQMVTFLYKYDKYVNGRG